MDTINHSGQKVIITMDASYLDKLIAAGYGNDRLSAFSNALSTALICKSLESKNQLFSKRPENGGAIKELHFDFDDEDSRASAATASASDRLGKIEERLQELEDVRDDLIQRGLNQAADFEGLREELKERLWQAIMRPSGPR